MNLKRQWVMKIAHYKAKINKHHHNTYKEALSVWMLECWKVVNGKSENAELVKNYMEFMAQDQNWLGEMFAKASRAS
jgi:hypothetical protein